jgi:hypothetical protein
MTLKVRHGCALHRIAFDASVGEEVCAIYMEEPEFADQYSKVVPFNLIVHSGLVRTPHGVVAFIVWQIAASSPQEVMVEQYLNPQNIGTFRLIASAAIAISKSSLVNKVVKRAKPKKFAPRSASAVDIYIGARMRAQRLVLKMSQEQLGRELGVSF